MKKILILMIIVLAVSLNAEIMNNAFTPELLMPSLINMNKLTMDHSMTFSSSFSSDNNSFYQSVYTNHLNYEFTPNLNLKIDLNFVNYGTATYQSGIEFEGNNDNTSKVLPNFQLDYSPNENIKFMIEFRQYNSAFGRDYFYTGN